jgi:hypothetical protein
MGGVWGVCVCSTALLIIRVCPCVRGAFVLFHVLRFRSAPQAICVDMLLNKSSPTEVANDLEALKSLSGVRELRYVTNDFFQFAYAGVSWFGDHLQLLLRASLIDAKVVCCVCGHFFLTTRRHTHAHHTYVCSRAITWRHSQVALHRHTHVRLASSFSLDLLVHSSLPRVLSLSLLHL